MKTTAQRVHIRPRYQCRRLLRCTAVVVLVMTGGLAVKSYAEEGLTQVGEPSTHAPAHFQSEILDDKALSAIRGKGGVNVLQPPINVSIILWDEPGSGGSKPHALVENDLGDSARGLIFNRYHSVSISKN